MEPDHEARVEIGCTACGEAITVSVYQARRAMATRCPGCGMGVALGTKTVQDSADEAERVWLAEQEAGDATAQ